jgi:hypothetical protein
VHLRENKKQQNEENYKLTITNSREEFLLKKISPRLVKKFPAFYGIGRSNNRVHNSSPPVFILGQFNPDHAPNRFL